MTHPTDQHDWRVATVKKWDTYLTDADGTRLASTREELGYRCTRCQLIASYSDVRAKRVQVGCDGKDRSNP